MRLRNLTSKKELLWGIVLAALLLIFYIYVYKLIPVSYYDEPLWIGRGYFFDLFLHGDFTNPLWRSDDGIDQPKLMELLYGFELYPNYLRYKQQAKNSHKDYLTYLIDQNLYDAFNLKDEPSLAKYRAYQLSKKDYIRWDNSTEGNERDYILQYGESFRKTFETIITARRINIIFLTAAGVALYALALKYFYIIPSLLIAASFGFNSLVIDVSLHAHAEALFIALFIVSVYLMVVHFSAKVFSARMNILCALCIGLCTTTKLNGIMLIGFYVIFTLFRFVLKPFKNNITENIKYAVSLVSILLLVIELVIVLNPSTYSNPIFGIWKLYTHRWETALGQGALDSKDYLVTYGQRFASIYDAYFNSNRVMTFNSMYLFRNFPVNPIINIINLSLFTIGIVSFAIRNGSVRTPSVYVRICFISIMIVTVVITTSYLMLSWQRYYIQISIFILWFEALGTYSFIKAILDIFNFYFLRRLNFNRRNL